MPQFMHHNRNTIQMFTRSKDEPAVSNSIEETTARGIKLVTTVTLKKSVQKCPLPTRGRPMTAKASFASSALYKSTKPTVHKIEWLQSIKEMTNERHSDYYMLLFFSTVKLILKTVGNCTAAANLTHSLSIHKTGNTKTKKQALLLCTKLYTVYIHNV